MVIGNTVKGISWTSMTVKTIVVKGISWTSMTVKTSISIRLYLANLNTVQPSKTYIIDQWIRSSNIELHKLFRRKSESIVIREEFYTNKFSHCTQKFPFCFWKNPCLIIFFLSFFLSKFKLQFSFLVAVLVTRQK